MNELLDTLTELKNDYFVEGIKQSFEDEGALFSDVTFMKRISSIVGLYMNVKIGGCEAKTDIFNCVNIQADGIVAPMIESEFALQKFIESTLHLKNTNTYINIESKLAVENLEKIMGSPSSKLLTGIIIGRSDLVNSFGKSKEEVDSLFITEVIQHICDVVKKHNLKIGMGGNITNNSSTIIRKLYEMKYLDYIETRNVIITINEESIKNLKNIIEKSLIFEKLWMTYKMNKYDHLVKEYSSRINAIQNRLIF